MVAQYNTSFFNETFILIVDVAPCGGESCTLVCDLYVEVNHVHWCVICICNYQ